MSNKLEAAVHGNAWDALDEFSSAVLSKSDVRTALEVLGGVFDEAALRTLTTKQLTCLTTASHAKPEGQHPAETSAIKAYQDARRKLASEPERETVGDWAGTGPKKPIWDAQSLMRQAISDGIGDLVTISGENSRDHGFHEDWPVIESDLDKTPGWERQLGLAITEKLALIHEEVSESLGEIRSGRHPLEIYFVDTKGMIGTKGAEYGNQAYGEIVEGQVSAYTFGVNIKGYMPLLKPEGFLVEQADAIIRIADLAFLVNGRERLIEALAVKHEYNSTRPYKHGRKF